MGIVVTAWIARYLGANNFGILSYAIAYTSFFSIFVKLGLDKVLIREAVRFPEKISYYLGTAFFLKFIGSVIALSLISISLIYFESNKTVKLTIFLISFGFVFQSFDIIDFYFQSLMLSKYVVIARDLAWIASNTLKIYLILGEFEVAYFALASSIEIFIGAILFIVIFKKLGNRVTSWKFDIKIAKIFIKDAWPIALNIFFFTIHIRIDQAMIKNLLDTEQLGIFSVAVKISEYWQFIPAMIVQTLMPYFVKLRKINYSFYEKRLNQLYSIMFWLGVIVGTILVLFGKYFLTIIFGLEYIEAYHALIFNIWTGIFISQSLARGIWVINENFQKYMVLMNIMAVLTNITLNIFLIPSMGIRGAALSSLISIGITTWIYSLFITELRYSTLSMIKASSPFYLFIGFSQSSK